MPDATAAEMVNIAPQGPALSATSDMPDAPVVNPPPLAAETTKKLDEPESVTLAKGKTEVVEPKLDADGKPIPEAKADEPAKEPPAPKTKQPIQERFSAITADRKAAEDRATKLADSLEKALDTIKDLTNKAATTVEKPAADPKPKREAFAEPDAYDEALVEWSARTATKIATAQIEAQAAERREADKKAMETEAQKARDKESNDAALAAWHTKREVAAAKYDDYAAVAEADDLPVTLPMAHAALNASNGPDILYYLGKNPGEAARIARLANPVLQAMEIGKIEAKLSATTEVSRTPAPITPVGARARATPKDASEESMAEYAARRQAELKQARTH